MSRNLTRRYTKNHHRLNKILDIIYKFFDDDIYGLAAELTFYLITSFFPFAILLLALISVTPLSAEETIFKLFSALPKDVYNILRDMLTGVNRSNAIIIFSGIIALWSMSGAITTISKGLNRMYKTEETRNRFLIRSIGAIFAFLLAVTIILAFFMLIFGNLIGLFFDGFFPALHPLWDMMRFIIMFFTMFSVFASLYKILPNKKIGFRSVFFGSVFTTILWSSGSLVFSFYVDNFSKHHIIYGSLAGIVVLVTWLYMTSFIILSGGEINSLIYEKRSAKL